MGMSMHFSPGDFATLQGSVAPQTLAGLNIMQHLARICARNDVKLIATTGKTDVYPLMETMVREAYVGEGNPLGFKIDDTVRFTSNDQQSDSAYLIDLYKREKVAGTVLIGAYGGGTLSVLGGAHMANSIIIFGTARTTNLAFGAGLSDAVLLGEEIYAAGALVSRDPVMLGSISGEEIGKWLSVVLIILGAVLSFVGLHVNLANLLKM